MKIIYASAAPTSGTYSTGDVAYNDVPTTTGTNLGWICTAGGTPGTWVPLESLSNGISVKQPYLIPTSSNTTMQVSANDLFNGTANKGPSWVVAGSAATLNSSAYPGPNVGPLNSKGYAVAYNLSPANVSAGPFTFVLLFNPSATDLGILFSTGTEDIDGLYCYETSLVINHSSGYVETTVGNTPVNSALNVLIGGMDASGNTFLQLNGGTTATNTGATITPTVADNTTLGYYTGGGQFTTLTNLYEFRFSTDVPSSGAFTTLYNQIIANLNTNTVMSGTDIVGPLTSVHSLAGGPAPTVGSFAGTSTTLWGTTSSQTVTGGDAAGKIQFTTGSTTTAIPANTPLFTVSLANAYSNSSYIVLPTLSQIGLAKLNYVIPDSNNTVTHVNADDLNNGTNRFGGNWTKAGVVPFNSGGFTAQDSVGAFSGTQYFTQPDTAPSNVSTGPWTIAIIMNITTASNSIPLGNGTYQVNGFYVILPAIGDGMDVVYNSAGSGAIQTTATLAEPGLNVFIFGVDAANTAWAQLNGGTVASNASFPVVASTSNLSIGSLINGAAPWPSTIYELMISTDVPSPIAFTNLYNQIAANLSPQVSSFYAVPATSGSFVVYNTNQFTPNPSTVYNFQFMTFGAGAQY